MMESPEVGNKANDWDLERQRKAREGLCPTDLGTFAHATVKSALRESGSVVVLVDHVDKQLHGLLHVTALVHSMSPKLEHTAASKCAQVPSQNAPGNCEPPGIRLIRSLDYQMMFWIEF